MNKKQTIYLLFLIIALGAFLRFYNLGGESFWLDEGVTSTVIKNYSTLEIVKNIISKGQVLPEYYSIKYDLPIYYMLLSSWADIFGISEFSLRSFSAIFGVLALIALFYLVKYIFNDKIALLSTFLASINLTLIWYSQEARIYSYLLFLSLLSLIFLVKSLKEGKIKYIAGLVITNILIVYSNFPWLIFITFEALYVGFIIYQDYAKKRALDKKIILAFFIVGLLYLPIIDRALFSQADNVNLYGRPNISQVAVFGMQLSTWLYPTEAMKQKIYEFTLNFSLYEWLLLFSVLLSSLLISLFFFLGILRSEKKDSSIFLLLMFFFPISVSLLLSLVHPNITIFQLKQIIYVIPSFLVFASIGILKNNLSKSLIIFVIILSLLPLHAYYSNPDKQQFREAAKYLPENEIIFTNIETAQIAFKYYYGDKANVIAVKNLEELESFLNRKLGKKDSFWMLLTFTKYSDPEGQIKNFLNKNYKLVEKRDFFDIELLHYESI